MTESAVLLFLVLSLLTAIEGTSIPIWNQIQSIATKRRRILAFRNGFNNNNNKNQKTEEDESVWMDIDEDDYDYDEYDDDFIEEEKNQKPVRQSLSKGTKKDKPVEVEEEEHPIRTDEWLLNIQLSPFVFQTKKESIFFGSTKRKSSQILKFSNNGYVLWNKTIGKWSIDTSGISFSLPITLPEELHNHHNLELKSPLIHTTTTTSTDDDDEDELEFEMDSMNGGNTKKIVWVHYHADVHLHKFGQRPKMFRGVITRDRIKNGKNSQWFRPVIATFTAIGIGKDTADTNYKNRGFGCSNNNNKQ